LTPGTAAEYEPFGYEMRAGTRTGQPLRFPGQELATTWEGPEENYNIFRWYRSSWGRYTQADPLGVEEDRNLFRYARNNPLILTDPLGLKAAVCCRLILSFVVGTVAKQRHCYISVDGVRFGLNRINDLGKKTINFGDDIGGICKGCEPKCGVDQMECFTKFHNAYPDNVPYPLLFAATGPNSNTYAANAAKTCCANGFPSGLGSTPGSDLPPAIPTWKDNFPEYY
jgi:RHS repeat-associated protein